MWTDVMKLCSFLFILQLLFFKKNQIHANWQKFSIRAFCLASIPSVTRIFSLLVLSVSLLAALEARVQVQFYIHTIGTEFGPLHKEKIKFEEES